MPDVIDTASPIEKRLDGMEASITKFTDTMTEMLKSRTAPGIRPDGDTPLSSQHFMYSKLLKAKWHSEQPGSRAKDYERYAPNEMQLCKQLKIQTNLIDPQGATQMSDFCAPFASQFLCQDWKAAGVDGGENIPGYTRELIKEVQQNFQNGWDLDPNEAIAHGADPSRVRALRKADDQRFDDATLGGFLGAPAGRGEMIDLLRPNLLIDQLPGVAYVPLGVSGSMEFPRHTGATSISAITERQSIPKSNVTFGLLRMDAKEYGGFCQYTQKMMRWAGNPMIEMFLRKDLTLSAGEEIDRDRMTGQGGIKLLGLLNIPGILTHPAATAGTNGDTLGTNDPSEMVTQIQMANVPGDAYFATLPNLWQKIMTRKDAVGQYVFDWARQNGVQPNSGRGTLCITSTNISQTRTKGSGTTLTYLVAIVPQHILIGQAGVADFSTTNAHSDNFRKGIMAVRMSLYTDIAARYPQAINVSDQLLIA